MKNRNAFLLLLLAVFAGCEKNPAGSDSPDGLWAFSKPESQGLNPQILDSAFVCAGAHGFVDGLVVIRNGVLVAERYYNGYGPSRPHNVMSVSKSFLSALTGIALARGDLDSLGERVLDYFPEYDDPSIDPRVRDVTIRHLLTMRMGIRDESEDDYGAYWELYRSENWIKKTLESPLIFDPGARMAYNTFETHLLSAILTKATGRSTLDFAAEFLCRPMGIDVDSWERDPQGYYFGGNAMHFTPRETAKLGQLYMRRGELDGVRVVPENWVALTLSPSTNARHPNEWGALENYNYAWLWWLGQINGQDLFMGYGYGGQFLVVFPGLDLIVVSTAKNDVDPDASTVQEWAIFEIISRFVLRSIVGLREVTGELPAIIARSSPDS